MAWRAPAGEQEGCGRKVASPPVAGSLSVGLEVMAVALMTSAWPGADLGGCPAIYLRLTFLIYSVKEPSLQDWDPTATHSGV